MPECMMFALTILGVMVAAVAVVALLPIFGALGRKLSQVRLPALPKLAPAVPVLGGMVVVATIVVALAFGWKHAEPCGQASVAVPKILMTCGK